MEIVIIGTGNTATILGKEFKKAGHQILQVYGRNSKAASDLAYDLDTESTNYSSVVNRNADLYIIAVSDDAIEEVLKDLELPRKPIVHTAASVSMDILKAYSSHYGVFYPLQSLKKSAGNTPYIPVLIDANDELTRKILFSLAESITSNVVEADDFKRIKIHLAAVFCNNFINHIYSLIENYCVKEGIQFQLLFPLIQETTNSILVNHPSKSQTGPALRKDYYTINKHLDLLNHYPHLKELYQIFTNSIQQFH